MLHRLTLLSLVVACSCSAPERTMVATAPSVVPPSPVVANAAPAPAVATGRTCPPAHFAAYGGATVEIVAIEPDCRTHVASTIEIDAVEPVFDVAWPRRDQPLALAVLDERHVLVFDQPLADAAHRPSPRKIVPPGKGDIEPEGHEFGLVTDGKDIFVERCASWGDDDGGGEEAEEWDCKQHIYFALHDKAGRKAKRQKPVPRDAFTPVFAGGTVPGTAVELRIERASVTCTVGGKQTRLEPWNDGVTPLSVIPVSATDYLLGVDHNGSRARARKHVEYTRYRGCEQVEWGDDAVPGPDEYWAEEQPGHRGWIIYAGDEAVLDANGRLAVFDGRAIAWTRRRAVTW
jgi:hypothetical protein